MASYYPIVYVRGYAMTSKSRGALKYNYRWSSENSEQTGALREEMSFPLPAPASRYLQGGSLRTLFDDWS